MRKLSYGDMWEAEKWPPKDVYILVPEACEYVSLPGKGRFREQVKLRLLK